MAGKTLQLMVPFPKGVLLWTVDVDSLGAALETMQEALVGAEGKRSDYQPYTHASVPVSIEAWQSEFWPQIQDLHEWLSLSELLPMMRLLGEGPFAGSKLAMSSTLWPRLNYIVRSHEPLVEFEFVVNKVPRTSYALNKENLLAARQRLRGMF